MKEYVICKLDEKPYDALIVCLSHESVLSYWDEIEKESLLQDSKGYIILDQLLVTGAGKNRFVMIPYLYGTLDYTKAKIIKVSYHIRKLSVDLLNRNITSLQNTILTDDQQEMVQNRVAI